jgi:cytochrome bd-type quinol oxidase subunit 1
MVIIRLIALLALVGLAICLGLYVFTRDRRYLRYAGRIIRFAIVVGVVFSAVFLLERLILVV